MPGIVLAGSIVKASNFTTTISNLATGSISSSTTETVIGSYTVPASAVNQGYEFHCEGTNDNTTGSPTVTFRLHFGTAGTSADLLIAGYSAITCQATAQTGLGWSVFGWMRVITAGSSGNLFSNITLGSIINANTTFPSITGPATGTPVNWTGNNFLTITAQWSASSASNVSRTIGGSLAALN